MLTIFLLEKSAEIICFCERVFSNLSTCQHHLHPLLSFQKVHGPAPHGRKKLQVIKFHSNGLEEQVITIQAFI